MAKGKTKAHKQAGKKKARRRMFKELAIKSGDKKAPAPQKRKVQKREHNILNKPLLDVKIPEHITKEIINKKDLLVSPEFANRLIKRYLHKKPDVAKKLSDPKFLRSAAFEEMKKWVRQELRVLVGMFVVEGDVHKLIDEPTATVLASHRSTAERLPVYSHIYQDLFGDKKPEVILDICAGLNPCSYEYFGCEPIYYAVDVSPQLMDFVQKWFDKHGITGKAWAEDITKAESFPEADTILIFKGTDVLERIRYGFGDELLNKFKNKRIIVSFATATISGSGEISLKKRSWVERWAQGAGKNVRIVDTPGERYYVLE